MKPNNKSEISPKLVLTCLILILKLSCFAQNWNEIIEVTASDKKPYDQFGWSVSISGNYALVGAPREEEDSAGTNTMTASGSAYFIERNTAGIWNEVQKIVANDRAAFDYFGGSVAISGNYAIIGAAEEDEDQDGNNTMTNSGSAYVFERDAAGVWNEIQKIVASDRDVQDRFGFSVSISDSFVIIGTPFESEDTSGLNNLGHSGSAYIFERNGSGVWNQKQKIVASDRAQFDEFGFSVSLSSKYAIVGAYSENEDATGINSMPQSGSAYIFERNGSGVWHEVQKVVASDRFDNDFFGNSVSISGNYAIIGAFYESHDTSGLNLKVGAGSAYIFERNGSGFWHQAQKIVASDRAQLDHFGKSVSISGNYAIIGAYDEDENALGSNTLDQSGSAYIFKRNGTGAWTEVQKIVATNRAIQDRFGCSVSISDSFAVIGAYEMDYFGNSITSKQGSAHIFKNGCPNIDTSTSLFGFVIKSNQVGANYQWIDCNNGNSPIPGANNPNFTATKNGAYAVVVAIGSCIDTSACININNIGLAERSFRNELQLSPNPTNGNFMIDLGKNYESTTITIKDLVGRIIQSTSFNKSQLINLRLEEPAGVYLILIESDNKKAAIRLIKE